MKVLDEYQIERPSNRGRFSADRAVWEAIPQQRFVQWQQGASVEDIAESEGAAPNTIRYSISKCEGRLSGREVLAIREFRHKLRTIDRLGPKCIDTLDGLLCHKYPLIQLKAADQVRKIFESDKGSAVQVNTQVNLTNTSGTDIYDFETELGRIRQKQKAAHARDRKAVVDITPQAGRQEDDDAESSDRGA